MRPGAQPVVVGVVAVRVVPQVVAVRVVPSVVKSRAVQCPVLGVQQGAVEAVHLLVVETAHPGQVVEAVHLGARVGVVDDVVVDLVLFVQRGVVQVVRVEVCRLGEVAGRRLSLHEALVVGVVLVVQQVAAGGYRGRGLVNG